MSTFDDRENAFEAKFAHDLSGDMDADAIKTTYDLFLRDAREKMGLTPSD